VRNCHVYCTVLFFAQVEHAINTEAKFLEAMLEQLANYQRISYLDLKKNQCCPTLILYKKHICGLSIIDQRFGKKKLAN
jgi:hypothetical protein